MARLAMHLLNRTHLALRILIYVARAEGNLVNVNLIADDLEMPRQYAGKLIHELVRGGFLESIRGRFGGIALARPAGDIRVGDVVQSIETINGRGSDRGKAEPAVRAFIQDSQAKFVEVLNLQTVQDFLPSVRQGLPSRAGRREGARAAKPVNTRG